ncbi:MAG: RAMP superfamily CRISPR-associated protein, partial [Candidatus Bathyarchaeia archaeon]
ALFDFEVVPPGNRFSLEILVENPEDYELGMLVLGFDFLNNGLALLGGGTSRGLGRVRFELDEAIEVTPNDILACLHSEESLTPSEPKLTDTTSISTPAEVILESADEGQRVVYACLKESGPLDHKGLVSAMQQQGWTKARLQMHKYANWKELFEKSIQAGIITKIDEKYYISGNISIVNQVIPEDPRTSGEEEKSRKKQEAEKKAKIWKEALYEKLKEALEGGKENV